MRGANFGRAPCVCQQRRPRTGRRHRAAARRGRAQQRRQPQPRSRSAGAASWRERRGVTDKKTPRCSPAQPAPTLSRPAQPLPKSAAPCGTRGHAAPKVAGMTSHPVRPAPPCAPPVPPRAPREEEGRRDFLEQASEEKHAPPFPPLLPPCLSMPPPPSQRASHAPACRGRAAAPWSAARAPPAAASRAPPLPPWRAAPGRRAPPRRAPRAPRRRAARGSASRRRAWLLALARAHRTRRECNTLYSLNQGALPHASSADSRETMTE